MNRKNALTIGIYPSGNWKHNVVAPEDLEDHITYNRDNRPGRILLVDGEVAHGGCLKSEFRDSLIKKVMAYFPKDIDMSKVTRPYW